ncbi:MAG: nitroreductase [Flavipsychrobacter sp.]|nr:nitroreductase [Flavipsychrobacter sp.]
MNDTLNSIYERRAVRKYKDIPVAKEVIEQLIAAGRMAPSAMNNQPWKFYIVTDKEKIELFSKEISEIAIKQIKHVRIKDLLKMTLSHFHFSKVIDLIKTQDHIFYNAPVVIFITAPRKDDWGKLSVGMCAQNILLAAKAMGLDTCPVGFAKFVMQTKDYYLLNIPAAEEVEFALVIGFGDELPREPKRLEDNVFYI